MMPTFMTGLVATLAALTILNLILLLAVIRRLRLIDTRAEEVPVLSLPRAGVEVSAFSVPDVDGVVLSRHDAAGESVLVAFVMVGCEPCHDLVEVMRGDARIDPDRTIVFVASDKPSTAAIKLAALVRDLGRTAMIETDGAVTAAFGGIVGFPAVLRIANGRVVSAGRVLPDVMPDVARPVTV
jgi:hypothetical protein